MGGHDPVRRPALCGLTNSSIPFLSGHLFKAAMFPLCSPAERPLVYLLYLESDPKAGRQLSKKPDILGSLPRRADTVLDMNCTKLEREAIECRKGIQERGRVGAAGDRNEYSAPTGNTGAKEHFRDRGRYATLFAY